MWVVKCKLLEKALYYIKDTRRLYITEYGQVGRLNADPRAECCEVLSVFILLEYFGKQLT